jgi:hypothetical protein
MDCPGLHEARAPESDVADVSAHLGIVVTRSGCAGKVVARLIGHTNADVTLNVYTQAMDESLGTAVDRVGNRLFNIVHSGGGGLDSVPFAASIN